MNLNNKRPKLIDSFLFFNEVDLLKVRLEYLGPIVDNFIIVEANIDFSGVKKEFILSNELLTSLPFSNKILYYKKEIDFNSFYWILKKYVTGIDDLLFFGNSRILKEIHCLNL